MEQGPDEIFVTFTFKKNKRQIYIDVNKNATLKEALRILTNKYAWLKNIQAMGASLTQKMGTSLKEKPFSLSDLDTPLSQLGVDKSSDIYILTDQKVDLFADAKQYCKLLEQQEKQNQQNNNNFNQFNNFLPNQNFNNFQLNPNLNNQFQFNQPPFNQIQCFNNFNMQNQPFNQLPNNMNMNNMQNNIQNQLFYKGSTRLREIYIFLRDKGFCSNPNENKQLINFLNALYSANYDNKLYCTYIPVSRNDYAWQQFKRLTSNNRSFSEAAYRILKLFPAKQTPERVIKDIGAYLSSVTNGQFMTYVEKNHNKQPIVNNNMNMNNQNMNMNNMNNVQNSYQKQPFYKSVRLQTIFDYLTNNGFCQQSNECQKLINFLNNLYTKGIYKNIPGEILVPEAWKNFRSLKSSNNRYYMEAVYRIFYLFPKDNRQAQLKFLECANVKMDDLLQYANSRKNIPNNQMMMNNMNMQNNFNLMNGFWTGDWFALDNRSIETLMQAAGINCDKTTLFNHICKTIDALDQNLQQMQDPQTLAILQRNYCLAMDFLKRYYSQEIGQLYTYYEYPLFFNMYDYSQRFVPGYNDPQTKQWVHGRITFHNPVTKKFETITMQEYNDLRPLPKFTKNKGCTCYLDSARNSILHNRYTKAILKKIGEQLSAKKSLGIESLHGVNWSIIQQLNDMELLAVFAYASELAYYNPSYNQLCETIIDKYFTKLEEANPLFKRHESGDIKDYYNYVSEQLIQKIHQGINLQSNIQQGINLQSNPALQANLYITYNNFTNTMATQETSLFCEPKGTKTYCHDCNNTIYSFGIYPFLENPLNEVKKYTNNLNFSFNNNILCTLDDCLWYEKKTDLFTGGNMHYCNFCKRRCNVSYSNLRTNSCYLPHLIFNSGIGNCFNERIYLDQYYKTPDGDYLQLVSFEIFVPGHYMSLHKVFKGQQYQWYLYNDTDNEAEIVDDRVIDQLLHYQYKGTLGRGVNTCYAPFTVRAADYQPIARNMATDITSWNFLGRPQENVQTLYGFGQTKCKKITNPLYNVFFDQRNNNFGEPNPNNPYTAVLGLQQLLTNLGLGNLVDTKVNKNVLNQYMTWNNTTQNCAWYNNNLNPAQPMNNMFMNNFMFQQQFMMPNNIGANMNMKQWINIPNNQQFFK